MKKLISMFFVATVLLQVVAGCSSNAGDATAEVPKVTPEQEAAVKDHGAVDKPKIEAPGIQEQPK